MTHTERKPATEKWCPSCRLHRPIDCFDDKARENGRIGKRHLCRPCFAVWSNESNRKRYEYHKKYTGDWIKRNPGRYRATRMAARYKSDGLTRDRVLSDMESGLLCPYCSTGITWENISYDHKDGKGTEIHAVCWPCNDLKRVFHHKDFLAITAMLGSDRLNFYRCKLKRSHYHANGLK